MATLREGMSRAVNSFLLKRLESRLVLRESFFVARPFSKLLSIRCPESTMLTPSRLAGLASNIFPRTTTILPNDQPDLPRLLLNVSLLLRLDLRRLELLRLRKRLVRSSSTSLSRMETVISSTRVVLTSLDDGRLDRNALVSLPSS